MKKQILILVLALFASLNLIKAQTPDPAALTQLPTYCVPATAVAATCVPAAGPNNPIPGQQYTYTVTLGNVGTAATIHWFATTDPNFIDAGVLTTNIETAGNGIVMAAGATYNQTGNLLNSVTITWDAFPASTDVFLVTYVTNDAGCADNIKVYKIEPTHLFTLDIARITNDGTGAADQNHCMSPVFSATYNAGVVEMDFGVNYLYYVVNAANWANSWMPSFELDAVGTASTTFAVDWAYPHESYTGATNLVWHTTTRNTTTGIYESGVAVEPVTGTSVGEDGECIIVRVTVDHNLNQGITDMNVTLAVDGVMEDISATGNAYTNPLLGDIHYQAGTEPGQGCPWYDGFLNDRATYTLTARPSILDNSTPAATFIPDDAE